MVEQARAQEEMMASAREELRQSLEKTFDQRLFRFSEEVRIYSLLPQVAERKKTMVPLFHGYIVRVSTSTVRDAKSLLSQAFWWCYCPSALRSSARASFFSAFGIVCCYGSPGSVPNATRWL